MTHGRLKTSRAKHINSPLRAATASSRGELGGFKFVIIDIPTLSKKQRAILGRIVSGFFHDNLLLRVVLIEHLFPKMC